jgi:hypothetical protein
MQHHTSILALALGALLLAGGGTAGAQSKAKSTDMTAAQVTAKLRAAGYTNVHDVEREGSHFDADATTDGRPVHLHVDAATGWIEPVANEAEEEEEEHEHHEHR